MEQAAALAGFEDIGAKGALTDEGVADLRPCTVAGPWQPQAASGGVDGDDVSLAVMVAEEVEGIREAASLCVDDEIDGATPAG